MALTAEQSLEPVATKASWLDCQLSFLLTLLLQTSPCSCTIRHYMFIIYDFVFVLAGGWPSGLGSHFRPMTMPFLAHTTW
ncbi:Protein PXR1 [Fusarium oxysporum f. sp. albedinis]|nr:Protein PXR1 [Fusarium oxysporum f. sp. albedinis]